MQKAPPPYSWTFDWMLMEGKSSMGGMFFSFFMRAERPFSKGLDSVQKTVSPSTCSSPKEI